MSSTLDSYINPTTFVSTPDGRQLSIDDLVDLYRDSAKTVVPISGHLFSGDNDRQKSLNIVWKVRDLDRLEATNFVTNYAIKLSQNCGEVEEVLPIGRQTDVTNELSIAFGPKYRAVVRKGNKDSESGKYKQWLEIWDKRTKLKSLDIDLIEEHSSLELDPQFGDLLWSPNGNQLLFTAQYKPPKAMSYFKKQNKKSENESKDETRGQEFVFRDDWGEGFDGISHTVIAVLDVESDFKIRTIELSDYSLGQPFWITNGESVGFVGWDERPRRLGIYLNRLSAIFTVNLNSDNLVPKLVYGGDGVSVRNPRPINDGKGIIFLENEISGPHDKAIRLMRFDIESQTSEVLFGKNGVRDIIVNENELKYGKLCTLFIKELPQNCLTSNENYLVFNCFTELQSVLFLCDLKTKQLNQIQFPLQSAKLIELKDDLLIAVGSSINIKPNVFIAKLNVRNIDAINWFEIKANSSESLRDISYEKYYIRSEDPNKLLTAILVSPQSFEKVSAPTIVWPHGGPHALSYITYMLYPILFAKLGFKTLLVNYRGSLGVDEDYVNTLIGNAGDMDVKDVIQFVNYFINKSLVDSSKLILFGGSHGGFLVTHLSGQLPNINFKACIARNPVIDLSFDGQTSDFPDVDYVESFGRTKSFAFDSALDSDSLKVMFEKSPINWINNVKVPTLFAFRQI